MRQGLSLAFTLGCFFSYDLTLIRGVRAFVGTQLHVTRSNHYEDTWLHSPRGFSHIILLDVSAAKAYAAKEFEDVPFFRELIYA